VKIDIWWTTVHHSLMKKYYWIYILECADGSYYTGITNNCEQRLAEHSNGLNPTCYTYTRRPVRFAYSECFDDVWEAIGREKQIKRWTRKKKEALLREQHDDLPRLAVCTNESHSMNTSRQKSVRILRVSIRFKIVSSFDSAQDDTTGTPHRNAY
jgi:putative endonuclease